MSAIKEQWWWRQWRQQWQEWQWDPAQWQRQQRWGQQLYLFGENGPFEPEDL